jgi:hypothetical protein
MLSMSGDYAYRPLVLAQILAARGRYEEAAAALQQFPPGMLLPGTLENAARLLRTAPNTPSAPLPELGVLDWVYLYVGAPERALAFFEAEAQDGNTIPIAYAEVWHPSYAGVRKTARFKKLVRDAGLVEYWKVRGWPAFCHPTTGDDFECS